MLYQLNRAGISQVDLVTVYISVVRPVREYVCPVCHMHALCVYLHIYPT